LESIPTYVRVRWASLNKSLKKIVRQWQQIVDAATADLADPRACHASVRSTLASDPLLLCKCTFMRELTRKMLVHIEFFEQSGSHAHEVYARLVAIQEGFSPLFDEQEIALILQIGQCPADRRVDMTNLITRASTAARNDWISKMARNQDSETIQVFQMIAVFDPGQKAAFTFTLEEILHYLRPIHDSIYGPAEAGNDPLRVLTLSFLLYSFS
jgi:hypothetical protein